MAYDVQGFAGIHPVQIGTLFDLEEIDALNSFDTVYYVRCVDVIGINPTLGVMIVREILSMILVYALRFFELDLDAVAYVKDYNALTSIELLLIF